MNQNEMVQQVCIEALQKNLAKLNTLSVVPDIESEEYRQDVEGYRMQVSRIDNIRRDSEIVALMTAPSEVKMLLDQIDERRRQLLRIKA